MENQAMVSSGTEVRDPKDAWLETAAGLKVQSLPDRERAVDALKLVKMMAKKIAEEMSPLKKSADDAKKAILDMEKRHLAPLTLVEGVLKREISSFDELQEKIRRDAEERIREQQRKSASEAKALEDLENKNEEQKPGPSRIEVPKIYTPPTPPIPQAVIPKSVIKDGTSSRTIWKFEVTDEAIVPRKYMVVDNKAVQGVVTALKEKAVIPGIRIYSEQQLSVRV